MFNKLKNLFAKDKTEHTADITQWVNAKADENNRLIDKEAEHTSDKIEKICAKLEENLSSLENMELQNKKVPKRVEQIIEGNRTTYVKNSRNFINRIDNKIEPQTFSKTIKDELENLGHANARGTKVLSEFFRNEVVSISQQLRALISLGNQLDKCIAELKAYPENIANHYVDMARKIAMKSRQKMPPNLKRRYCKHCYSYLAVGKNCRIRNNPKTITYTCLECKRYMRFTKTINKGAHNKKA